MGIYYTNLQEIVKRRIILSDNKKRIYYWKIEKIVRIANRIVITIMMGCNIEK